LRPLVGAHTTIPKRANSIAAGPASGVNSRILRLDSRYTGGSEVPTVREVTYEVLRNLRMTTIFGNPGSTELPFLRDMPAQQSSPVIFIVLRKSEYSALKGFCDFTQVGRNVPGMDLPGLDAVKIAEGYGIAARAVDRAQDLEPALGEAFRSAKPCLQCRPGRAKVHGYGSIHQSTQLSLTVAREEAD
jgi:hypothetical protein